MFDPVKLLYPHYPIAGYVVYGVDGAAGGAGRLEERERAPGEATSEEIIGLEVGAEDPLGGALDELAARYESESVKDLYLHVATRRQLRRVLRWLRRAGLGTPEVFGIDADFYFSAVPMTGPGNKEAQAYVAWLRQLMTRTEEVRALVKRLLIRVGRSRLLYSSFLVLVPRSVVSAEDLGRLLD